MTKTTVNDAAIRREYAAGVEGGQHFMFAAEKYPVLALENVLKMIKGVNDPRPLIRAYWQGYHQGLIFPTEDRK